MKAHLISIAILIGIIILCIGMIMSKCVLIGFMGTALLVFAYCCVYLTVIRNMNDRNGKNKI
jgi:succinate-acetate transporter protein